MVRASASWKRCRPAASRAPRDGEPVNARDDTTLGAKPRPFVGAKAMSVLERVRVGLEPVNEVTRGDARVIPSRQLQVVQSLDGGVVVEILVREGQLVEAGQLLLRVDETRAGAGVRESAAQGFSLRARAARLRALAEGAPFIAPL